MGSVGESSLGTSVAKLNVFYQVPAPDFVIIGIDINLYFADTEQKTGFERNKRRLMVIVGLRRDC